MPAKRLQGMRVGVTGATGFLGAYYCKGLHQEGASVVAVVRSPEKARELVAAGIEVRKADLSDRAALADAFSGLDAVISNAAVISVNANPAQLVVENVQGVTNVAQACARAGVSRLVQMSSIAAYRQTFSFSPLHETSPLRGQPRFLYPLNAYGTSKGLSEIAAWQLADELGLQLSTVRSATIIGAFDQKTFRRFFDLMMAPPVSLFPSHLRVSMVYAMDIVRAVSTMLVTPQSIGKAFNITGDERAAWGFLDAWKLAGGRVPSLVLPVPVPVTLRYDLERANELLGWRPGSLLRASQEIIAAEKAKTLFH